MSNWQRFKRPATRGVHTGRTDSVGLTPDGRASLSRALAELWGPPALVAVLYDRDQRLIGLQPTRDDDPDAFRVTGKGATGRQIRVKGVLWQLGWQGTALCRLPAHLEGSVLVVGPLPSEEEP